MEHPFFMTESRTVTHVFATFLVQSKDKKESELVTLTLWVLMSYIYGAPILDVSRSHTTTQHSR